MSNIIEIGGGASGGSNVVANPIEAASDTLTKIGIDGTVYDISGGGGGSGYSETILWSGSETPSTSGTQINLSDNISNYDEIVFVMDTDYVGSNSFLVSQLTIGEDYIGTIYAPSHYGAFWSYDTDTTITIKSQSSANLKTYTKVIGIKYGGASGHNYSTTEHIIGTWVDGSILYEKTIHIQPSGNTSDYVTAEAISGINAVIDASFTAIRQSDGNTWYYTGNGSTYPESLDYSNYKLGVRVSGGNLQYYIAGYGTQITDIYATIRYTKTS